MSRLHLQRTSATRALLLEFLLLAAVLAGCGGTGVDPAHDADTAETMPGVLDCCAVDPDDSGAADTWVDTPRAKDFEARDDTEAEAESDDAPLPPALVAATWNVHNFSEYGVTETRMGAVVSTIRGLDADIVALQEIKTDPDDPPPALQAWDRLLASLPEYEGIHAPWDYYDTTVGLLVRRDTTEIVANQTLFPNDSDAFPRSPLMATVHVQRGGAETTFDVIVLHLKAYPDGADRRLDACQKLHALLARRPGHRTLLLGDLNDDPYDPPAENVFLNTFLGTEPDYVFLTARLPPQSVTSVSFYHFVDGRRVVGQFLDHAIVSGALYADWARFVPEIRGVPTGEFRDWEEDYSDHFPVLVSFEPTLPAQPVLPN